VKKITCESQTIEGAITMQISRHWRVNAKRYRLEGIRLEDGSVSLQERVIPAVTLMDECDDYDEYQTDMMQPNDQSLLQQVAS
jgi:hypothetical protein